MNHKRIKGPGDFEHPDFYATPDAPDGMVPCDCVPEAKWDGYCLRCDSGWVPDAEQEAEAV